MFQGAVYTEEMEGELRHLGKHQPVCLNVFRAESLIFDSLFCWKIL